MIFMTSVTQNIDHEEVPQQMKWEGMHDYK